MERYIPPDVTLIAQRDKYMAGKMLLRHGTPEQPRKCEVYVVVQLGRRQKRRYYTNPFRAKAIFDRIVVSGENLPDIDDGMNIDSKEKCIELLDELFV